MADLFNKLSSFVQTKEEDLINEEAEIVNEIYNLVVNQNEFVSKDQIKQFILSKFSQNGIQVLTSKATPLSILLDTIAEISETNTGILKHIVSKMLYTQTQGDDLTLASANFGHSRIEAKPTTLYAILTADKDLNIEEGTSFTDGGGTIWLSSNETSLKKDIPSKVLVKSRDVGAVNIITPLNLTTPIAGITNVDIEESSIVIGRDEETDASLKATISSGFQIAGTDNILMRELLQLQMVNSAFSYTNFLDTPQNVGDVLVDEGKRYISVRLSSTTPSAEEADLIAYTIMKNSVYKPNFQKPKDGLVSSFFGLSKETLTKPFDKGGAGLSGVNKKSNAVIVRMTTNIYNNFVDIYFYLAKPIYIDIIVYINYINGAYTNSSKENLNGELKKELTTIVAELSRVGTDLLISEIVTRLKRETLNKITIENIYLSEHQAQNKRQGLVPNPYQYFEIYKTGSDPYAGITVIEGRDTNG